MSELMISRTPAMIATEIYSIKGQTRDIIMHSSVEIGRRLVEAKEMLPHGEWMEWLKNSVEYSQSTANNLMQIYREYGDKIATLGNLSYTKALALLGVPEDEREQFVQDNDVENVSAKQLQQVVKEKQKLEEKLKKSEFQAEHERINAQNLARNLQRLQEELEEAKLSGDEDGARDLQSELDTARKEIATSQTRITELETELKQKPIDVGAVVERVPEEVEAELAELRKKVAQPNSQSAVKFRFCFEAVAKGFQELLVTLDEVKVESPEAHEKYKNAVSGLIGKMSERLV